MDGFVAPFLAAVLGSFVLATTLLLVLILVDGLRQRQEPGSAAVATLSPRDHGPHTPRPSHPTALASRRRDFTPSSERAKAA